MRLYRGIRCGRNVSNPARKLSLTNGLEGPIGAFSANTVDAVHLLRHLYSIAATFGIYRIVNAAVVAGSTIFVPAKSLGVGEVRPARLLNTA